jgi:hypothetical protein
VTEELEIILGRGGGRGEEIMDQLRNSYSTALDRLNKTMKNLCYIF